MTEVNRPIRSFVLRAGRMTAGQERGWSVGFPQFGLTAANGLLDWESGWETQGRRVVEIGFGMGDSLLTMAETAPADRFLGIEVHTPGVGRLLGQALERELQNIRVYAEDAMVVLDECIPKGSVDILQIFFPDPWHKKRHHKRRLIQPDFIAKAAALLATSGRVHLATDWMPYAEDMLSVLQAEPTLRNTSETGQYVSRPSWRPETKFERRGTKLGHCVRDLVFEKRDA
ncbi:MAG: tRNA (guanosine(46)-N7)-methyltransferase TrmB [Luminiphilus sp.]|nr:tRNA (guanosine(46)-N7)-methyltransferase TrmB [Luminiphilus sp.]